MTIRVCVAGVTGHIGRPLAIAVSKRGVHIVVGTSGLTDDDYVAIDTAARARRVGVLAAGNFSITAVLLQRFACEAAKYVSQWSTG